MSVPEPLSELLSDRSPTPFKPTEESRHEFDLEWAAVDSNLYLREGSSPTERGWEGPLGSAFAGVGRSLKAFGYIAISYCQAGVPRGATGRRDAENRVQREA